MPWVKAQWFDNDGDPASGYQLFTYEAGSATKLATYSDVDLAVPNTNPIILDSAGRATIFLSALSYKFVLSDDTDTDPPTSPLWTVDNVAANSSGASGSAQDITGTAGEALVATNAVFESDGTGSRTAGRWYKTDSDDQAMSTYPIKVGFAMGTIASAATGTIRILGEVTGLTGLTAGTTYYLSGTAAGITATAPTNARIVGVAKTATTLLLTPERNYWRLATVNGGYWERGVAAELLTIAAAATTDTTANLLPANSIIEAVCVRVTALFPTAATFTVGDATTAARFATGVSVAAGTTAVGLLHQQGGIATDATGPVQTAAAKVRITPNATPAAATGEVRIEVFYSKFVAPGS
jgi:hypothetical protein